MCGVVRVTKQPKSFSLTEKNAEFLEANGHLNNSALVNDLLDSYRKNQSTDGLVDQIERNRLERERESLKSRMETLDAQLTRLETVEEKENNRQQEALEALVHRVENGKTIFPDHSAVEDTAQAYFSGDVYAVLEAVRDELVERGIEYDSEQIEGLE